MNEPRHCARCQLPLVSESTLAETCPRCLLLLAMGADFDVYKRIGPYETISRLGSGGMGTVYKAFHQKLQRIVALKVMRNIAGREVTYAERFLREARAAASLNHPNTVAIYDVGEDDGLHFLAMEFIDGFNLQERVEKEGPYSWPEAALIGIQALSGLAAAHEHGILHRDIKPHNILINGAGQVKISDFGLAKRFDDSGETLTQPGCVVGSPAFMAPEQIAGGEIDGRADLFSMGSVLYFILTGSLPFHGKTSQETFNKVLHEEPRPLRSLNPEVPKDLASVVMRSLSKRSQNRFATADEMRLALEGICETGPRVLRSHRRRPTGRLPCRALLIGGVGLIVLVAALFLIGHLRTPLDGHKAGSAAVSWAEKIPDAALRAAILADCGMNENAEMTLESLAAVTSLRVPRRGVRDLRGIENLPRLETLDLSGNDVGSLVPLGNVRSLRSLDLSSIPSLEGNEVKHLTGLSNLVSLQYSGKQNMDAALETISTLPAIEQLSIEGGPYGSSKGVAHLGNCRTLTGLSLMHFIQPINGAMGDIGKLRGLTYLNLTGSNVGDEGIELLRDLHRLRFLALGGTSVTDSGIRHLERLQKLEMLLFLGEGITDRSFETFARLQGLDYLCVADCRGISDDGLRAIASHPGATALNLSGCRNLTATGIAALKEMPRLRELHLGPGPATGSKALAELSGLPNLTHLILRSDLPLTNAQLDGLMSLQALRLLGLPENALTIEQLEALQAALPQCHILTSLDPYVVHRYSGVN